MSPKTSNNSKRKPRDGIAAITIKGYKSICKEQRIELRPLTILAGANSSGKSSAIQPLLLLKQTLECSYDPGPILLMGPNVRFNSADQLLTKKISRGRPDSFFIDFEGGENWHLRLEYHKVAQKGLDLHSMKFTKKDQSTVLKENMSDSEIKENISFVSRAKFIFYYKQLFDRSEITEKVAKNEALKINRRRCFLEIVPDIDSSYLFVETFENSLIDTFLRKIIHLPGLRGNPQRTYPRSAIGGTFPGVFQDYVASVVFHWKDGKDQRLDKLSGYLRDLGLTWKVDATQIDETQIELKVGRLINPLKGGARDLVNIADVGFGVSQVLPVVVALLVAEPGQIVYIEQPEIHLHPSAQVAMAELLADAAKRGVIVVAETHSSALLLGVQALVAEKKLSPDLVKLHWFERGKDGFTKITSRDLDENGAFGDWPEDFGSVELELQRRYLDAPFKTREHA